MAHSARVATWLELAVAPAWRLHSTHIRVHPVGPEGDQCFAVSMDGRRLCATNGKLTTFRGRRAVEHFLSMVHVDDFEFGAPYHPERPNACGHFCLCLNQQDSLTPCDEYCEASDTQASCKAGRIQSEPRPLNRSRIR